MGFLGKDDVVVVLPEHRFDYIVSAWRLPLLCFASCFFADPISSEPAPNIEGQTVLKSLPPTHARKKKRCRKDWERTVVLTEP